MKKESFIKATEAWLRNQDLAIESSDLNIKHLQQQISMFQKMIAAEQEERKTKIELKVEVLEALEKYKKRKS